jgi:hypothetical protein
MNLTDFNVFPTAHKGVPCPEWQFDVSGETGVLIGLKDLKARFDAGDELATIRFIVCDHPKVGPEPGKVHVTYRVGMGHANERDCFRLCGEDKDPWGVGSEALVGSYYPYADDPAFAAVTLVRQMPQGCIFRVID